jgi:cell volume regulation protein A
MAYILTISFTYLITHGNASITGLIFEFFQEMIIGGVLGYILGRLTVIAINKVQLETEGLYPVLSWV